MADHKYEYQHREREHNLNAPRVVVPIIMEYLMPKSVLDIGCGLGTWLKVFSELGVDEILGVEGNELPEEQLHIGVSQIKYTNLTQDLSLSKRYDLALCLEVAEHLPESAADTLIESLTKASLQIVFSAAVPNQGGQHHINEQYPSYWAEKFAQHGYIMYDVIRPKIWDDPNVDWWYRQNILWVCHKDHVPTSFGDTEPSHRTLIHPELLELQQQKIQNLSDNKRNLPQIIKSLIANIFNK